ncbi:uncharacterized protein LOC118434254 [Folsomia candida]|uniref:uncharacterized protein LOC118434254 n=1 Tax=Folsomia candida TaxID=158441 RepID=UPI0016052383|nr:uncharacterized protein LOC118434254 [Folsomia candida]
MGLTRKFTFGLQFILLAKIAFIHSQDPTTIPTDSTTATTTEATTTTIFSPTLPPLPNATIPAVNGIPCTLSVTALFAVPVAQVDGLCYDDKIVDRVCCKNLAVLGTPNIGLVLISQTCPLPQYCCILRANIDHITGPVSVYC